MSDGPYKSLNMPPHWRRLAKRADLRAFAPAEICEALPPALAHDWKDDVPKELVQHVGEILRDDGALFPERTQRLEALRRVTAGHAFGCVLLECAVQVASSGATGPEAMVQAAAQALGIRASRGALQVEEHYCRKSTVPRAHKVRLRIDQAIASVAFSDLARQLLRHDPAPALRAPAKHHGIDEGVSL